MIELPVGTLPVDFFTFNSYVTFSQSGGKTRRARSRFQVREKEIAFLPGNFDNVRFSENYCCAVHKGDAESLTDLIDRYLSLNSTSFIQADKHVKEKNHKRYSVCSLQPLHNPVRVSLSKPLATMYEKQIQCSDCDLFSELPVVLFFFVWFVKRNQTPLKTKMTNSFILLYGSPNMYVT